MISNWKNKIIWRPPFQGEGGGVGVLVVDKLFISTPGLYGTVLEVNCDIKHNWIMKNRWCYPTYSPHNGIFIICACRTHNNGLILCSLILQSHKRLNKQKWRLRNIATMYYCYNIISMKRYKTCAKFYHRRVSLSFCGYGRLLMQKRQYVWNPHKILSNVCCWRRLQLPFLDSSWLDKHFL